MRNSVVLLNLAHKNPTLKFRGRFSPYLTLNQVKLRLLVGFDPLGHPYFLVVQLKHFVVRVQLEVVVPERAILDTRSNELLELTLKK